jgi:short-subunit dehydrogenase involved in D-alanine esterification of teichoic acids
MIIEQLNERLALTLTKAILLSKIFMSHLRKSQGAIINISSTRHILSEETLEIFSSKGAPAMAGND